MTEPTPPQPDPRAPAPVSVPDPTPAAPDETPTSPDPTPAPPPIAARPVDDAPDPGALVPLTELAPAIQAASVSRRAFLGFGLAITGGLVGAAALAQLYPVFADDSPAAYPIGTSYDPSTKRWLFVVDTATCIGCGMCVAACKEENHVPEDAAFNRTWVERHVRTTTGEVFVDAPDAGINGFPPESTAQGAAGRAIEASWFEPRLCMQCANSPCTVVCPVGATYKTPDGVILVDARRCIGCGYCVVACPYGARYLTPAEHSPSGVGGVADKCTWCYHRISRGGKPACVEVCPVGARRFGEESDPEMQALVAELQPQQLHPEFGTEPVVLYAGPSVEEA